MDEQTGIDKSAKAKEQEAERHREITQNQKDQNKLLQEQVNGQKLQGVMELAAILDQSGIKVDAPTLAAFPSNIPSVRTIEKFGGETIYQAQNRFDWNIYQVDLKSKKENKILSK